MSDKLIEAINEEIEALNNRLDVLKQSKRLLSGKDVASSVKPEIYPMAELKSKILQWFSKNPEQTMADCAKALNVEYQSVYTATQALIKSRKLRQTNRPAKNHRRFEVVSGVDKTPTETEDERVKAIAKREKTIRPVKVTRRKPGETKKLIDEFLATHAIFHTLELCAFANISPGYAGSILNERDDVKPIGWVLRPGVKGRIRKWQVIRRENVITPGEAPREGRLKAQPYV